jgi:hypothetical protein
MILGQKPTLRPVISSVVAFTVGIGFAGSVNANPVTVTDITDWATTPAEVVAVSIPYLSFDGALYAGINTLSVNNGGNVTVYNAFCVDPFHWALPGPISGYNIVPLVGAPKAPGTLNAATATDIEDLWAEFYSPSMSSASAAGLQIAIWELVSSNAIASGALPANEGFSLTPGQSDFGASLDLASLSTYTGPTPSLLALTGPGQDYLISPVPDGGETFVLLALAAGAMILARPTVQLKPCPVSVTRNH